MLANKLYGIKDSANVLLVSTNTGDIALDVPQPNSFEVAFSNTGKEYARYHGKNKIAWDGEKEGTITMSVEIVNSELLAFMSRAKLVKENVDVYQSKTVTLSEDGALVSLGVTASALLNVFTLNKDNTHKEDITSTSILSSNKQSVTLAGAKTGDKVKIFYIEQKQRTKFTITADNAITEDYMLIADVKAKKMTGGVEGYFQYKFFKVSPNFDFTLGQSTDGVSSFDFTFEILADEDDNIMDYIDLLEDDEEEPTVANTVYFGGILDGDKEAATITQSLLDGMETKSTVNSALALTVKGDDIDGKSILIVSTEELSKVLDVTSLDILDSFTKTEIDLDSDGNVDYYAYWETSSVANTNADVDLTLQF